MTSLSNQLLKLALPDGSLGITPDKSRPSLLFTAKDAALFDKDTIYDLGANGFAEICLLEPGFHPLFHDELFSEKIKDMERTMQTHDFNAELDKTIDLFLLHVSQYFLLRPAQKCIEWLIYRFHVHTFNVTGLLRCILPYHATNVFTCALKILKPQKSSAKWAWLRSMQEGNSPFSTKNLALCCTKDASFFQFVCDMVVATIKVRSSFQGRDSFSHHVSFFSGVLLGMIQNLKKVSNERLSTIIPILMKSFASRSDEFQSFAMLVVSQLSVVVSFEKKAVVNLVQHCTKHCAPHLEKNLIQLVVLLCETQASLTALPDRLWDDFLSFSCFSQTVTELSSGGKTEKFLTMLFNHVVRKMSDSPEVDSVCYDLITRLQLSPALQTKFARLLLGKVFPPVSAGQLRERSPAFKHLLSFFQQKYSAQFDIAITSHFKHAACEDDDVMSFVAESVGSKIPKDNLAVLSIGLLHPAPVVRVQTLIKLRKYLNDAELDSSARKFAHDHVKQILMFETDESVVRECLQVLTEHSYLLDDAGEELYDHLIQLVVFERSSHDDVKTVLNMLMSKLLLDKTSLGVKVQTLVLHMLIKCWQKSWNELTKSIVTSKSLKGSNFLKKMRESYKADMDKTTFIATLIAAASELNPHSCFAMLKYWNDTFMSSASRDKCCVVGTQWLLINGCLGCKDASTAHQVLPRVVDVLCCAIERREFKPKQPVLVDCLSSLIEQCIFKSDNEDDSVIPFTVFALKKSVAMLRFLVKEEEAEADSFPLQSLVFHAILSVNQCVKVISQSAELNKFHQELLSDLFKAFFAELLPSVRSALDFLSRSLTESEANEPAVKLKLVRFTSTFLRSLMPRAKELELSEVVDNSPLLPTLLMTSACEQMDIRRASLQCMKNIAAVPSCNASYLCMFLCEHEEEIVADSASVLQQIRAYFDEDKTSWHKKNRQASKTRRIAYLKALVTQHVLYHKEETGISKNGLQFLRKCLHLVNNPAMFNELYQRCLVLLDQKSEWKQNDLRFLSCVVEKALTGRFAKADVPSLITRVLLLDPLPLYRGEDDSPVHATLGLITKKVFTSFTESGKQTVLAGLLDLQARTSLSSISSRIAKVFKSIPLQADHVTVEITKCREEIGRRCGTKVQTDSMEDDGESEMSRDIHVRRLVGLLEALQHKKQLHNPEMLCDPLCAALQELMVEKKIDDPGEYVAQLTIGSLLNVVKRTKLKDVDKKVVLEVQKSLKLELVVSCIQMSENTLLHRQAVLLLAESVRFFPDKVVHVIMSIFTFMGSSLLRKDDSYSFQVISHTIQSIVPALMSHKKRQSSPSVDVVLQIVQVFVDALPHIPTHRRLTVFEELLRAVGPHRYLWTTLLLILDQRFGKTSLHRGSDGSEEDSLSLESAVEVCTAVSRIFEVETQINSVEEILSFLIVLPSEFEKEKLKPSQWTGHRCQVFNAHKRTGNQLCNFRLAALILLSRLLSHGGSISHSFDGERSTGEGVDTNAMLIALRMEKFESVLLKALQLDQSVLLLKKKASETDNVASHRYYDVLSAKMVEVLEKIDLLLPTGTMLMIVSRLLQQHAHEVHLKLMRLLVKRISYGFRLSLDEVPLFQSVAEHLVGLLLHKRDSATVDITSHRAAAATALARVVRICGTSSAPYFTSVVPTLCEFMLGQETSPEVLSSCLLCLAELISALKAHCIVHLSSISSTLIKFLGKKSVLRSDDLVHSTMKAVFSLFQSLASFLSPHLIDFLSKLTAIELLYQQKADSSDEEPVRKKLKLSKSTDDNLPKLVLVLVSGVFNVLARKLASRVLFPAFNTCYDKITNTYPLANISLVGLANNHLRLLDKPDISLNSSLIFSFYLKVMDFRKDQRELPSDKVRQVEDCVLDGVNTLLLKLPEEEFQFVYHKLYVWGCSTDSPFQRSTTFYRCVNLLAVKLKGLFSAFAVDLVQHIHTLFEVQVSSYDKAVSDDAYVEDYCLRMSNAVDMMTTLLQHDEGFMNRERFDLICSPMVNEIEKVVGDDDAGVTKMNAYVHNSVLPCLACLAMCSNNNIGWRTLHNMVLSKTRHNRPEVRRCALDAILAIGQKLGPDYITMVPDTVPFLAELMEDDDADVEKHCHHVVAQLEEAVGESLQKYF